MTIVVGGILLPEEVLQSEFFAVLAAFDIKMPAAVCPASTRRPRCAPSGRRRDADRAEDGRRVSAHGRLARRGFPVEITAFALPFFLL